MRIKHDYLEFDEMREEDIPSLVKIISDTICTDLAIHDVECKPDHSDFNEKMIVKFFSHPESKCFCFYLDDELSGGLIYWSNKDKSEGLIGMLFVKENFLNMGVGTKVWEFLKTYESDIKNWYTEVPYFSRKTVYFFVNKLGFKVIKINKHTSKFDSSCLLEYNG